MKGLAFRKLSRTTGHRNHLLRNLVTSLFEHERIQTTVAKAKETQREAEKVITALKRSHEAERRGADQQWYSAKGYLFGEGGSADEETMRRLARRYAERPGGYTRLHLYGNRPGDHAPRALLELVDNEKGDLRLELTARYMARQIHLQRGSSTVSINSHTIPDPANDTRFHPLTRSRIAQLLRFPDGREQRLAQLLQRAQEQLLRLRAEDMVDGSALHVDEERMSKGEWKDSQPRGRLLTPPVKGRKLRAGVSPGVGMPAREEGEGERSRFFEPRPLKGSAGNSVIRLGKGAFARRGGVDRVAGNPVAFRSAARGGEVKGMRREGKNVRVRYS